MKPQEWIHKRGMQRYVNQSDNDRALATPPDTHIMQATLQALLDYLDLYGTEPGPLGPDMRPLPAGANGPTEQTELTLRSLVVVARKIWGPPSLTLPDIVIRLGVDYGKLARLARGATKDSKDSKDSADLKDAFGNIIFSMLRWADDLGLDPVECVTRAIQVHARFVKENPVR